MNGGAIIAKWPWIKYVLHGIGGGAAVAIGLAAIQAVKDRPEFLPQLLGGNVLFFAICVVGMVVFDRRLQSYADLHARSVTAQEALAANVGALVSKDELKDEVNAASDRYMASQLDLIVTKLGEFEKRLPHVS